jgi:hypothetical protein
VLGDATPEMFPEYAPNFQLGFHQNSFNAGAAQQSTERNFIAVPTPMHFHPGMLTTSAGQFFVAGWPGSLSGAIPSQPMSVANVNTCSIGQVLGDIERKDTNLASGRVAPTLHGKPPEQDGIVCPVAVFVDLSVLKERGGSARF